ncbi:MAG: hypothetical protein U5K72_18155 [Balneolaceae bacterium]|nr:hypothetical protein [Balneolaceae bacterium]
MADTKTSRRDFIKKSSLLAGGAILPSMFYIGQSKPKLDETVLGHGDFQYRVHKEWGNLNPENTPVKNCHEMVMDSKGRLIMITDDTRNNIIIYDKSGKLLDSWGDQFPGGHGLTLFNEGGKDVLFITDFSLGKVFKTTVDGQPLLTIDHPKTIGEYSEEDPFRPTETAIAPNGDIYVADGYGSQFILRYDSAGKFIRKFGGEGDADHQFSTAHGVAIDDRNGNDPTLLCTSRGHNSFKRFTMDGEYLETIFLPGAFVCRPVIDDGNIYSGVCWSRLRYLNQTDNSGFVTILNEENRVVSNPGGTKPEYENGELQLMVQQNPLFKHCHDVCVDEDKNLYVCQWNAAQTYPIKLERV